PAGRGHARRRLARRLADGARRRCGRLPGAVWFRLLDGAVEHTGRARTVHRRAGGSSALMIPSRPSDMILSMLFARARLALMAIAVSLLMAAPARAGSLPPRAEVGLTSGVETE